MIAEWIVLNAVKGLGPTRIRHLVEVFGDAKAILTAIQSDEADAYIPQKIKHQIQTDKLFEEAHKQIAQATDMGITILSITSPEYPRLLKEIYAPPPVLYVLGRTESLYENCLGVVGTRHPTQYGYKAVESITAEVTKRGLAIVSGLAMGIDTAAHKTCLQHEGTTIAVLGCAIDMLVGKKKLVHDITHKGAIISEFPLGTSAAPWNFPRRNRIISGLSSGVLVIEAGHRSGSLITANYAMQQGRDVFTVPGSIFSDKSCGTFELIKEGAIPVRNGNDICDELNLPLLGTKRPHTQHPPTAAFPDHLFNKEEQKILKSLGTAPTRLDQLIELTGFAFGEIFDILLNLELKGAIRQVPGQQYIKS